MFILYGVLVGMVLAPLLGGDLRRLSTVSFRWAPVILGGLLVQIVLFRPEVASRIGDLGVPVYVGSTLAVLVAVLRNIRIPGLWIIFAGGSSNAAAIITNGGYMPASAAALASLGGEAPEIYSNSAVIAEPALGPLTDIFAMPAWMPFANVFSIGDVLIGMGVVCAFVAISRRPAPSGDVAPGQLTLVRDYPRTDSPLAPWDSRRSVSFEGHQFLGWNSVQGKPVVRRGTQS